MGEQRAGAVPDLALEILILGPAVDEDLAEVARALSRELRCSVVLRDADLDAGTLVEPERGQVHAGRLLERLDEEPAPESVLRRLGILAPDLYRPGVTFEFGEAPMWGSTGVLSLHRFREENYGLPPSPLRLRTRLYTEALHELGHTFGLGHCDRPDCAMGFSFDVGDVDAKGPVLCPSCRETFRRRVRRERARRRSAPPRRRRVRLGLAAAAVLVLLTLPLLPWGPGTAMAGPIRFSHEWHLEGADLDCVDCHVDAGCGEWTGLPDIRACARCHEGESSANPELAGLEALLREGGTAPWCLKRTCPGGGTSFHEREIHRGGSACRSCHGSGCATRACSDCHESTEVRSTCDRCHP